MGRAHTYRHAVASGGEEFLNVDVRRWLTSNLALGDGEVYSQPTDTGIGIHESTQLVAALDALKKRTSPVRLEDFALMNGINALLDPESSLFQRFKKHHKVVYDKKTDLWSYKPDYEINSPADLVALLREKYYHPSALTPSSASGGMRVAELRESYPPAREVIEELASVEPREDREILVLRGKRDGVIKYVFWNPVRGDEVRPIDGGAPTADPNSRTCGARCVSPTWSILRRTSRARVSARPRPSKRRPSQLPTRPTSGARASVVQRRASSSCKIHTSRRWISAATT